MKTVKPQILWAAQTKHGTFWWIKNTKKEVSDRLRELAGSRYAANKKFKIVKVSVTVFHPQTSGPESVRVAAEAVRIAENVNSGNAAGEMR